MSFDKDADGNGKNCIFNYFRVMYCFWHNIVPVLTKSLKKNYCFWIKSQFIILTFNKKGKKVANYGY